MAKRISLDNVCVKKIPTLSSQYDGLIDYVDISSVDNTEKRIVSMQCVSAKDAPSRAKQLLEVGDILVSTVRPNLNAVAMVEQKTDNLLVGSTGYCVLRCNNSIDKRYVFHFCQSPYFVDDMTSQATGASYPAVSSGIVKSATIPDHPIETQKQIADRLDKVTKLITLRKQQLTKLDLLVKARFVEMFGDGKYPTVKASDVCGFITKGTTPPTGEIYEEYESGRVPYLKVYNLSFTGELLFDSAPQYISGEIHNKQLARSKVFPDDVLMNIVGPPLGKFSLVTNTFDEWNINQAIAIFRAKEKVLPRYLMAALMQPKVLRPFLEQAVGIRQLNLSLEQCRNLEFPLPPLEEQKEFVAFAEQTDKSKSTIQQSLEKLELLKKSLMQAYFG